MLARLTTQISDKRLKFSSFRLTYLFCHGAMWKQNVFDLSHDLWIRSWFMSRVTEPMACSVMLVAVVVAVDQNVRVGFESLPTYISAHCLFNINVWSTSRNILSGSCCECKVSAANTSKLKLYSVWSVTTVSFLKGKFRLNSICCLIELFLKSEAWSWLVESCTCSQWHPGQKILVSWILLFCWMLLFVILRVYDLLDNLI